MCQSLKPPAGGITCQGTARLGGRGLRVTRNTDKDTVVSPPASVVVIVISGSPAVGQEAATRGSKVRVHARASRPWPPGGPRRRVVSLLRVRGQCPGAAARPSGRRLTKRHGTQVGSPWADWTWRSVQAELGPKQWSRAGARGRSSRKQSQHHRAGRGQDPSRARTGELMVG